jgi:hypothetical protein
VKRLNLQTHFGDHIFDQYGEDERCVRYYAENAVIDGWKESSAAEVFDFPDSNCRNQTGIPRRVLRFERRCPLSERQRRPR